MTFIVPAAFTVYGVPQKERPPCLIQCDVVELVRSFAHSPWKFRNSLRRGLRVSYTAYVRLPAWIAPPENWPRLETGEIELRVPLHFNQRVPLPEFPADRNRVRIDEVVKLRGDPC